MALYLFLFTISTAAANHETISLRSLCERTGLPISWWSSRALVRALEVVNEHLATLDAEALQDEGIKLPGSFEIVSVDGRVRFRRVNRQCRADDDDDYDDDGVVRVVDDADFYDRLYVRTHRTLKE